MLVKTCSSSRNTATYMINGCSATQVSKHRRGPAFQGITFIPVFQPNLLPLVSRKWQMLKLMVEKKGKTAPVCFTFGTEWGERGIKHLSFHKGMYTARQTAGKFPITFGHACPYWGFHTVLTAKSSVLWSPLHCTCLTTRYDTTHVKRTILDTTAKR